DGAEDRRRAGGRDAAVAGRGGRGVRAVPAPVAGRVEFPRHRFVDARVAAEARVVVARADQLLVAVARGERLAGHAAAVPAGDLLVAEPAVLRPVAVAAGAVGEARVLRPDA